MGTDITKIIGEIKNLQASQSKAQLELSKFEGQLEQEMKRLKTDFNLSSIKDASAELEKLNKKVEKIDSLIIEKYRNLKDNYDVPS